MPLTRAQNWKRKEVIEIHSENEENVVHIDGKAVLTIDLSKSDDDEDINPRPKKTRRMSPALSNSARNALSEKQWDNGQALTLPALTASGNGYGVGMKSMGYLGKDKENASSSDYGGSEVEEELLKSAREVELMRKWVDEGIEMATREINGGGVPEATGCTTVEFDTFLGGQGNLHTQNDVARQLSAGQDYYQNLGMAGPANHMSSGEGYKLMKPSIYRSPYQQGQNSTNTPINSSYIAPNMPANYMSALQQGQPSTNMSRNSNLMAPNVPYARPILPATQPQGYHVQNLSHLDPGPQYGTPVQYLSNHLGPGSNLAVNKMVTPPRSSLMANPSSGAGQSYGTPVQYNSNYLSPGSNLHVNQMDTPPSSGLLTPSSNLNGYSPTRAQNQKLPSILPAGQYLTFSELESRYYPLPTRSIPGRWDWLSKLSLNKNPFIRNEKSYFMKQEVEDAWAQIPPPIRQSIEDLAVKIKYGVAMKPVPIRSVPKEMLPLTLMEIEEQYFYIPGRYDRMTTTREAMIPRKATWLNQIGLTESKYHKFIVTPQVQYDVERFYGFKPIAERRLVEERAKYLAVMLKPANPSWAAFNMMFFPEETANRFNVHFQEKKQAWLSQLKLDFEPFNIRPGQNGAHDLEHREREAQEVVWHDLGEDKRREILAQAESLKENKGPCKSWREFEAKFGFSLMDFGGNMDVYRLSNQTWLSGLGIGWFKSGPDLEKLWAGKTKAEQEVLAKRAVEGKAALLKAYKTEKASGKTMASSYASASKKTRAPTRQSTKAKPKKSRAKTFRYTTMAPY